jgi:hypothetical protein
MDDARFDSFARSLADELAPRAERASRRGFVAGLFGFGVGLAGLGAADAQSCPPGRVVRQGQCVCRLTGRPPVGGVCPCPRGQTDIGDGRGCSCPPERSCPANDTCCPGGEVCAAGGGVCCPPQSICTVGGVPDACCNGIGACVDGLCILF